MITTLI